MREIPADAVDDDLDGHAIVAAFRDDQVGKATCRLDEGLVHRANGLVVLLADLVERPAALLHVAPDPPQDADIGWRVDEELDVEAIDQPAILEEEDPLDDDNRRRRHRCVARRPPVRDEIVVRPLDAPPSQQRVEVLDQQGVVETVWMVVVDAGALLGRQIGAVAVVGVVLDVDDVFAAKLGDDGARDGGLSRAGSARDSDHQGLGRGTTHRARKVASRWRAVHVHGWIRAPDVVMLGPHGINRPGGIDVARLAFDRITDGPRDLVILHGILGSGRNWRSVGRRLAVELPQFGVVTVDLRGHGDSHGFALPHTVDACVTDLDALASAGVIRPWGLIGHSFGGKVALCAARGGRGLAGVWALDSAPGTAADAGTAAASDDVWQVIERLARIPLPAPDRDTVVREMEQVGLPPAIRAWMTTNLVRGPDGLRWRFDLPCVRQLMWSYGQTDAWPALEGGADARPRIHFVRAGKSERWQASQIQRLEAADAAGHCKLHTLEQAGHWVHVDAPDALLECIASDVRSLEGTDADAR